MSSIIPKKSTPKEVHNHKVKLRPYSRLMHWYRWSDVYIPLFNPTARLALKMKYLKDQKTVNTFIRSKENELEDWFNKTTIFFGFSSPRSGTVFLTDLFIQELKEGITEHEANIVDYLAFTKAIQSNQNALDYIENFRKKDIYYRTKGRKLKFYGEINPFLRMHCKAIKELIPHAKLFQIVRDGREVVRSVMSRDKLGKKDPMAYNIEPPEGDLYHAKWKDMTRFEKVCWQWQFTNRFMRENIDYSVSFKQIRTDYDYFKEYILDYIGINISQEAWQNYVNQPKNKSAQYRMPHWKDWKKEELDTFWKICGKEMEEYDFLASR